MSKQKLVERTIKHKLYTYYVEKEDQPLHDGTVGTLTVERQARRGETVEMREADANRGDSLGAFYTEKELEAVESGSTDPADTPPAPPALDLANSDTDEIRAWLVGEGPGPKPSVPQVLNAVNTVEDEDDRVEVAQRVLEAERSKSTDPRSTLTDPLDEFLNSPEED